MLVVSRRNNDSVVFPTLGIEVKVLRVSGNVAKLGIDAPREIPIQRHEVADRSTIDPDSVRVIDRKFSHELRNRINTAMVGLCLLHKKLEAGHEEDVEPALYKILLELEGLEEQVAKLDGSKPRCRETVSTQELDRTLRALLVEDNANEAELLAGFLRTCNFEIDTAGDGAAALDYLSSQPAPEMVLLDMTMPGLDGPATIERIRSNPQTQHLKVFAVTGMAPEEVGVEVGPRGVDRWFRKPINPLELVSELRAGADEQVAVSA